MSVSTNIPLTPMVYVCIISHFNLPEFESCLLRRPSHVVLVVSQRVQERAELFTKQLKEALADVVIIRPDAQHPFAGSDVVECMQWMHGTLLTAMNALPAHLPRVCNITGGTKAITLSLSNTQFNWAWLDYKAEQQQQLQRLIMKSEGIEASPECEALPMALPLQVAGLSAWRVTVAAANIISEHCASLAQAKKIWNALSNPQTDAGRSLLSLFGGQHNGFEKYWLYRDFNATKDNAITCNAAEFVGQPEFSISQLTWLAAWHALAPSSLQYTNNSICFASVKNKKDPFRRWLSGDWLEQWVAAHVNDWIPSQQIASNIKINPLEGEKSSFGERETDLLVHYQGRTTLIEVKTDMPPNGGITTLLNQITSMGDRLGKTRKVLFLGPQLAQKIVPQLASIEKRCVAANVILCSNASQLQRALGITTE